MSAKGQERRFERASATSALPQEADIRLRRTNRRNGPTGDILARSTVAQRCGCLGLRRRSRSLTRAPSDRDSLLRSDAAITVGNGPEQSIGGGGDGKLH
jgi:hypothetical protein